VSATVTGPNSFTYAGPRTVHGGLGTNPFTTNGTNVVTVSQGFHGRFVGSLVSFSGATTFNNVNMNGNFVVNSVPGLHSYTRPFGPRPP
jgi:hypothetical protein